MVMSKKLLVASVAVLAIGVYTVIKTRPVNPVDQNTQIITLQKNILAQLELQTDILSHIREDSLNEHE
jgi:hypothetical protein